MVEQALDGRDLGIGAEVEGAVLELAAGQQDAGEVLPYRDLDVGIGLVVLPHGVEEGLVLADEAPLQKQASRSEPQGT